MAVGGLFVILGSIPDRSLESGLTRSGGCISRLRRL